MTGARRLLAAAALGALAGLWTWTAPGHGDRPAGSDGTGLYLLDNGFHTDLALPRAALEARPGPLAEAVRSLGPGDWVLIGWGDARFYVDQRPIADRLPDGARAFFSPGNRSVLMLDPEAADPARGRDPHRVRLLVLPPDRFEALAAHVERTLATEAGSAVLAARHPTGDARFFAAHGHFWILNLCNNWAARALNAAGLPVRPMASGFSGEVLAAVDRAQLDRPPARD